jgi:tetratricopeptide (TPR) repeat protein
LVLVLAGVGYLAWAHRADLVRVYHGLVAEEAPQGPRRANPLRRYLASWRLAHPDVSGTPREHLLAAEDFHLQDTWKGYERAERAYQRALLLDENDPEAIAGYVENLAIWRYPLASSQELGVARKALEYALELDPESGAVRRALGALALAAGDLRNCRAGADAALERSSADARARLVLAGCYVDGNVQLAIREAELARRAEPGLHRADRVLAAAFRRAGRFRSAYRVLDQRLEKDPRNAAVHLAYGELEASLARYGPAAAHFRRAAGLEGDRQAAFLALGALALERRQDARAIDFFRRAASVHPPTGKRGARLYAEWARAELRRRARTRARKLAEQALKFEPKNVAALLVLAERALSTGSATTARALVRRARKERSDEPAALVLEGRIALAEGRDDAGLRTLRGAVKSAPKDARLYAVLAGGYLDAGRPAQAYATMRKATDLDPSRAHAIRRNTALSVSESAQRAAIAAFERSAREPRNASVAYAAIALIHFHLGETAAASRAARRALALDDANLLALVYEAQAALDTGALGRAERAAKKILLVEQGSALGHLLRARVAVKRGREEAAREGFQAALRTNPGLLAAEVELAALDLASGAPEDAAGARQVLLRAFTIEPDLLDLRRLLLEHEP